MTSKQVKSIKAYPLGRNTIKIETDQDDFEVGDGENKIITRTPDHFAINKETIHAHAKDAHGDINAVLYLDPLTVKVSGYSDKILDGYDGVLLKDDGSALWRGVIRSANSFADIVYDPAYYSDGNNYWLMGGINLRTDGYIDSIFHSIDGVSYSLQDTPPWDARANSVVLGDGAGNIWLVGGSDYSGYKQDIWKGTIDYDTGIIAWDDTALVTGQTELNKYVKNGGYGFFNQDVLFINDLVFNLTSNTFNNISGLSNSQDGYGNTKFYDQIRNIYHNSNDTGRIEVIYDDDGQETDTVANPFGYTFLKDTAASSWGSFNPTLPLGTEIVVVCFDSDNNLLSPNTVTVTETSAINVAVTFNASVSGGRAFILDAYQMAVGSTWTMDGYDIDRSAIWCNDIDHNLIEPESITKNSDTQFTLNWAAPTDGYIAVLQAYHRDLIHGRRYVSAATNFIAGDTSIIAEQYEPSVYSIRNSSYDFVSPSAISMSQEDGTTITLLASETANYGAMYMRHDGYNDLTDPYNFEYNNIGYNAQNNRTAYILGDGGVWKSSDNAVSWERKNAVNLTLPTDRLVPVVANTAIVGTVDMNYLTTNSVNSGNSWTDPGTQEIGSSIVTFWGELSDEIDSTWRFFAYPRPADVIWEKEYGAFPETLLDDYSTNYVLPYPAVVTSDSSQNIQFILDDEYDRPAIADEFANDWVYLFNSDGYTIEKQLITGNSAASIGSQINVYTYEFAQAPTIGDKIQIVKSRPEGINYYSVLTRDETYSFDIYTEDDGTAFIDSQERVYDYYAHRKMLGTLPAYIAANDSNNNLLDLLQTESDRQRVIAGQSYNDPYTVPPELLDRLGLQFGLDASGLPLKIQRRAIANWYSLVDAYGWCLDGLDNIKDLILGPDSQVGVSTSNPNAEVLSGIITNISITNDASNHWNYLTAVNIIKWDPDVGAWYMEVASSDIISQIKTLKNTYLAHFNKNAVDGPFRIVDHVYNDTNDTFSIYFDNPLVFDITFVQGSSVLAIFDKDQRDRVFKYIDIINKIKPHWSNVHWT